MSKANFIFFGSADVSVYTLSALKDAGILPVKVVTLAPAPYGRGRKTKPNPTDAWAQENGIPVIYWKSSKDLLTEIKDEKYDFALVYAFGKILEKELLDAPNFKCGFVNIHPSLLPYLRGPSPIRSAILLDKKDAIGVTIIKMDEQMDHGPILLQEKYEPESWPLCGTFLDKELSELAAKKLAQNWNELKEGRLKEQEQAHEKANFTKFFEKSGCEINFESISGDGQINGKDAFVACACDGNPSPFFFAQKGSQKIRVKINTLENKDGKFYIKSLVPENKKEMSWQNFKNFLQS